MNSFGAALIALGIGVALASAATIESVAAADSTATGGASPTATGDAKAPQATRFGALDYFQSSCARCHGDYGSFYGATFGKNLDNTQMRTVVHDMAFGPAQAPIDDKNLEVLVAWHRALRDQKPFLSVVKAEPADTGWKLSGEVSPGATLQLNGTPVPIQGHTWTATTTSKSPLQLEAKIGEQTTTLDAMKAAYASGALLIPSVTPTSTPVPPPGKPQANVASTTKIRVVTLTGAAAVYYYFTKARQVIQTTLAGKTVMYYLSKNGRVYYRDPQTHQAIWVTPSPQQMETFRLPFDQAQKYKSFQGYNNSPDGKVASAMFPTQ